MSHDTISQKAQENARSVPDHSPRKGVGSGDETIVIEATMCTERSGRQVLESR